MGAPANKYRSYEEFEREELHQPEAFVQTLDDFHARRDTEEELNLFDKIDAEDEEEDEDEDDDE